MAFEDQLYATIGSLVGGRVYPLRMPENPVYPVILWSIVGGTPTEMTQDMQYVDNPRLRLDVWGNTFDDVLTVGAQILSLLAMRSQSNLGFSSLYDGKQDILDADTGNFRRIYEFRIWMSQNTT